MTQKEKMREKREKVTGANAVQSKALAQGSWLS